MRRIAFLLGFLFTVCVLQGQNGQYLLGKVLPGEGAYAFLERFGLDRSTATVQRFTELNELKDLNLYRDTPYRLPIRVYIYNGQSIRSTIGISDYDHAVRIQAFNEALVESGIKEKDYREDRVLWVPDVVPAVAKMTKKEPGSKSNTLIFPIFGKDYEKVTIASTKLTGHVYYIVAGHGGPDPGAVVNYQGHQLSEDEYAYDISLRLARNLIEQNATVYVITRDKNDGIRNEAFLKPDKDEVCYPDQTIPLNQVRRLNQRVDVINDLYKKHKNEGVKKQRAIIIHVDSRSKGERIDMFFYHNPKSNKGKELATTLRNTIREKYEQHQRGRGYSGTVKARNLHMLRETHPVAVYAELGNIRNNRDQKRFIIEDNRQAVANWLCEGLLNEN
jgi:N-acetylmuramoyl-L-alanine amidase